MVCMELTIRPCDERDLEALHEIGRETYDRTFRPMNAPETIDAYLSEAFTSEKLLSELRTEGCSFYFLYADGELAGYLKLNNAPAQSDLNDPASLEIERIYVREGRKGVGLGTAMMRFVLQKAAEAGKKYTWLGVWEKNTAALAFYRKWGFTEAGTHSFRMGDELQTDFILKRAVGKGD
jgi:ribosomal protein S18 acetylase RimI-like enzyme